MSTTFPYTLQPQPPPMPKTSGGKRGPSAPIAIIASHSDDEESEPSITEHTPPLASRLLAHDISSSPGNKGNVISVSSLPSPRSVSIRKFGLALPNSKVPASNNNNAFAVNLNHVNAVAIASNTSYSSLTSITPAVSTNIAQCQNNETSVITGTTESDGISSSSSLSPDSVAHSNSNKHTNLNFVPSVLEPPSITSSAVAQQTACTESDIQETSITESINQLTTSASGTSCLNNCSPDSVTSQVTPPIVKEVRSESPTTPRNRSCSPYSNFAYEHDHDYENVASPCSSTASGPIYVRPPGFKHHAQEILVQPAKNKLKKKKCSATLITLREGYKKRESTPPKLKPKREPLPMKLRALPQSFWQQPNVAHQVSPATLFPILPPLPNKDTEDVMMDVRPVTPPDEREALRKTQVSERKLTVANTDLLFKLFEGIGEEKKGSNSSSRARTIKPKKPVPKSNTKGLFLGNDPYMMDAVADKIFPQLTLEGSRHSSGGNTSLQLITLREGDRTVTLPSLSLEQNYPQMLSELVMHI